ncbi:hypothetical protein [Nocardia sp. CY41]|uniref:hypothetical protein n=1 Tax=Nocardia sp. CY41 TaxID=2608686 RepID=UPI00135CDCDF|nr:hypothetical protein [Nocardia sp. CY41]
MSQSYGLTVGRPAWLDAITGRSASLPALWRDKAKTETRLFSQAHAEPDGYDIMVDTGRTMQRLSVNGYTFGRVLAANEHLLRAVRANPKSLLIQMSCSPASGPASRESARALHEAGLHLDVYAANETVEWTARHAYLKTYTNLGVNIPAVDAERIVGPHWEVHEAPRGPAEK